MTMHLYWIAYSLGGLAFTLAAEAALQLYASCVAKPPRLFRSDALTGWSNKPNLLTTLVNAAGEEWTIRIDENGQRLIAKTPSSSNRILILGDH